MLKSRKQYYFSNNRHKRHTIEWENGNTYWSQQYFRVKCCQWVAYLAKLTNSKLYGDPSHNQPPNADTIAYTSKILLKGPLYNCLLWGYARAFNNFFIWWWWSILKHNLTMNLRTIWNSLWIGPELKIHCSGMNTGFIGANNCIILSSYYCLYSWCL
jgi:hypothetical protein